MVMHSIQSSTMDKESMRYDKNKRNYITKKHKNNCFKSNIIYLIIELAIIYIIASYNNQKWLLLGYACKKNKFDNNNK